MAVILTVSSVTAALFSWTLVPSTVTRMDSMQTCKSYVAARLQNEGSKYEKHMQSADGTKLAMYNENIFVLPGSVQGLVYQCEEVK